MRTLPRRAGRVLPVIEVIVLAVALAAPLAMTSNPELITLATNVLILSLLAISFDLCWGYSGIMSFGQALFFGVAGYTVALIGRDLAFSHGWGTLPIAMVVGLLLAFVFAAFLLLGRRTPTVIFVALGTLTGAYAAERLVSGWQYVGAGNGLSSVKLLQFGSLELVEGPAFYYLALAILLAAYLASRYLVRSQFGLVLAGMRQNEERLAFLQLSEEGQLTSAVGTAFTVEDDQLHPARSAIAGTRGCGARWSGSEQHDGDQRDEQQANPHDARVRTRARRWQRRWSLSIRSMFGASHRRRRA